MSIDAHNRDNRPSGESADTGTGTVRPLRPRSAPDSAPDSSPAAARLLEMTARETDQWRTEARSEADAIVAGAREEAARLVQAARTESERLVTSAQEKASETVNDARVEAYRVREKSTAARKRNEEEIAQLEQLATQHRAQLRGHLTKMLDEVDSTSGDNTDQ